MVLVVRRCDSDDPIVWARLVTWGTNGLPWLPGTAFSVIGALFAVRSVAAHILIAVAIANVSAVGRSARKVAARVFQNADGIAQTVAGDAIFVVSASWLAVVVALLGGRRATNLPEDLAVVPSCFGGIFDGRPSAFLLPLSLRLWSSCLLCNARFLSCSL